MLSFNVICILSYFLLGCTFKASGFLSNFNQQSRKIISSNFKRLDRSIIQPKQMTVGRSAINNRLQPLKDILGLGPAEIAITLVVGLVLFGPETLKSLSKDVGRAAAELKEIPKTFKEVNTYTYIIIDICT